MARGFVVAGIARVLAIVPGLVRLLLEDRGRREPVASGGSFFHQDHAVVVEQVALGQVHDVERPAATDGVVDDLVHLRGGSLALGDDTCRFGAVVDEDVVGGEALDVRRDDRDLAQHLHRVQHLLVELGVAGEHDLHRQRAPGREERVVDEATLGACHFRGNMLAGNARGCETDQAVLADDLLQAGQDLALGRQILRGRLEDVVAIGQVLHLHRRDQSGLDHLGDLGGQLAPREAFVHVAFDALHSRIEGFLSNVQQVDLASPGLGQGGYEPVGQVGTDGSRTDHADIHLSDSLEWSVPR